MPIIIANIELDETNVDFNHAAEFDKHTDRLIYLTGKAERNIVANIAEFSHDL